MTIHLDILNPRQAEAGKIKIGGLGAVREARNGNPYQLPVKHDYFTVTKTTRDDTGNFVPDTKLMEKLEKDPDGKIRDIPILLDSDYTDEVFPHQLACYHGRNLHCHGNGKDPATRYEIVNGAKTGSSESVSCPCDFLNAKDGLVCKPHGTLWCTIAGGTETRIGVSHSFRTTSWNSIRALVSGIETIRQIVGTMVGIPLWLCVRPKVTRPRGSDKSNTIYVVHVECRTDDLLALQNLAIAQGRTRQSVAEIARQYFALGLPAPADGSETPTETAWIQQEYHPDGNVVDAGEVPDDIEYNPETGEVYDDSMDPPSPEPQSQESEDPNAILHGDHQIRQDIQKLLTDIAMARDFSEGDLKTGRQEIWTEACEAAKLPGLTWKDLTTSRAQSIGPQLQRMLDEAAKR